MIDAVYVLGSGTGWQDNELRYSLRSLRAHVPDIGRVFVVGRLPAWLKQVEFIAWPDRHRCKERNIMEKVCVACKEADLSSTFLHVHDDHFALHTPAARQLPAWYAGHLHQLAAAVDPRNPYRQAVLNTEQALKAKGRPTLNFDVHVPILYDRERFPQVMAEFDWTVPGCYVVKSLYANSVGMPGTILGDNKLSRGLSLQDVVKRLTGRPWWSVGNPGLTTQVKELLAELYPDRSVHEG